MVGDFWCRRSMQKGDSWQALFFFDFLIFMFKVTPMLLHFFTPQRFNARKCSLCQTLACTDRRSHKQKLLLLWGKKPLKNDLDACIKHIFFIPETFENIEKASPVYLCRWQKFSTSRRDTSPSLVHPKRFLQKKISGRYNAVLRNLPKTFCQRNQELQLNGQKGLTTFFSTENPVCWNISSEKVKCTFKKPRWKFFSRMLNGG